MTELYYEGIYNQLKGNLEASLSVYKKVNKDMPTDRLDYFIECYCQILDYMNAMESNPLNRLTDV